MSLSSILSRGAVVATAVTLPAAIAAQVQVVSPHPQPPSYRLLPDSIRIDGSIVGYRVEMTYPPGSRWHGRLTVNSSEIDCATNRRRHLGSNTRLPDGTQRSAGGAQRWLPLRDWEFGRGIRDTYCPSASPSAPR